MRTYARIVLVCVVVVLIAGGTHFGYLYYQFVSALPPQRGFDSRTWKLSKLDSHYSSPRVEMTDDLLKNRLKAGMTRHQVHLLLGPSDNQSEYQRKQGIDGYLVGRTASFSFDPATLEVHYDRSGKLLRAELHD